MIHLWTDFLNWTGSNNVSGNQYGFFSGFGSDISEFLILGGIIQLYHAHNCHVKGCARIGKHRVGHYVVCKKHHPGTPKGDITMAHILAQYSKNKEGNS